MVGVRIWLLPSQQQPGNRELGGTGARLYPIILTPALRDPLSPTVLVFQRFLILPKQRRLLETKPGSP